MFLKGLALDALEGCEVVLELFGYFLLDIFLWWLFLESAKLPQKNQMASAYGNVLP